MKLAVINCKKSKYDKYDIAEKIYSKSKLFRVQLQFITAAYDSYLILSAKYGIIFPQQKIMKYNVSINDLDNEEKGKWGQDIIENPIWKKYDEIHFFVSNAYWNPIKDIVDKYPNKVKHIKQQSNIGLNIIKYQEAQKYFEKTGKINLDIISIHQKSKTPEIKKWFYHPIHEKLFGYVRNIIKIYPEVDKGNLYRVSMGKATQTIGWHCDPAITKYIKLKNGKWKYDKQIKEKNENIMRY